MHRGCYTWNTRKAPDTDPESNTTNIIETDTSGVREMNNYQRTHRKLYNSCKGKLYIRVHFKLSSFCSVVFILGSLSIETLGVR